MQKKLLMIIFLICIIGSTYSHADPITNGSFDTALTHIDGDETWDGGSDATNEWSTLLSNGWGLLGVSPDGQNASSSNNQAGLIQVMEDNGTTTGLQDLSYIYNSWYTPGNTLRTMLYGFDSVPESLSIAVGTTQWLEGDELLNTIYNDSAEWDTITYNDIDFGTGYDYIALMFIDTAGVAQIDNVSLTGGGGGSPVPEPSTVVLLLLGICGLGWRLKRKK